MTEGFHPLKVAEVRRETADSISIRFALDDEQKKLFRFEPGQHLTLRQVVAGEELRRNYSVCAAPQDGELRIAIKQIAGGRFSGWANSALAAGMVLEAMPPHGSFTWNFDPARRAHYVGFAGGSGITPILSLLKTALIEEPQSRFTLFYGNRTSAGIMFLDELADLKDRYLDRLRVFHLLEDEERETDLLNGRLDAAKMAEIVSRVAEPAEIDAAFVCGPGPMMRSVEAGLREAGVPAERILIERFTVDRPSAAQEAEDRALEERASGLKVQVTIEGRRRTLVFDADKGSILENARAAGIPAPYACKAGVCATCKARLIAGEVRMKANYGLSPSDQAQGYVLTCQAVPLGEGVVLDFDL